MCRYEESRAWPPRGRRLEAACVAGPGRSPCGRGCAPACAGATPPVAPCRCQGRSWACEAAAPVTAATIRQPCFRCSGGRPAGCGGGLATGKDWCGGEGVPGQFRGCRRLSLPPGSATAPARPPRTRVGSARTAATHSSRNKILGSLTSSTPRATRRRSPPLMPLMPQLRGQMRGGGAGGVVGLRPSTRNSGQAHGRGATRRRRCRGQPLARA